MLSALAFVSMGANDCVTSYNADIDDSATVLSIPTAMHLQEVGFTYDALGRLLSKTFGTTVTRWVWNGNVPLHQWRQRREYSVMEGGWETNPTVDAVLTIRDPMIKDYVIEIYRAPKTYQK